jgi:hypothetical protein
VFEILKDNTKTTLSKLSWEGEIGLKGQKTRWLRGSDPRRWSFLLSGQDRVLPREGDNLTFPLLWCNPLPLRSEVLLPTCPPPPPLPYSQFAYAQSRPVYSTVWLVAVDTTFCRLAYFLPDEKKTTQYKIKCLPLPKKEIASAINQGLTINHGHPMVQLWFHRATFEIKIIILELLIFLFTSLTITNINFINEVLSLKKINRVRFKGIVKLLVNDWNCWFFLVYSHQITPDDDPWGSKRCDFWKTAKWTLSHYL